MGELCVYAIKSALCLAVMYVPYMLMLRNETFYRFNRFVLVSIVTLSFVLPALNIAPMAFLDQTEVAVANRTLAEVGMPMVEIGAPTYELADGVKEEVREIRFGWANIIVVIYIIGVVAVFSVKAIQLVKMLLFMRRGCLWIDEVDGVKVYCHARQVVPFSWMRSIVVSENDYNESGRAILLHEKAHIRCGHSADVCLVALCEVVQWFNPFVWLLSSSLSDVHEYEADAEVLKNDIDARSYQMLLIKKAVGSSSYTFANSFNHSLLKKRITMMMKKKSSPWMRMKALYVIPMAAFALSAFATSEFTNSVELISESKVGNFVVKEQTPAQLVVDESAMQNSTTVAKSDTIKRKSGKQEALNVSEKLPQFPGGPGELMKFISTNIRYPQIAQWYGVQGRYVVGFVVETDGTTSEHKILRSPDVNITDVPETETRSPEEVSKACKKALEDECIRVIKSMPAWTPGIQKGKKVRAKYTIPFTFRLQ